MAPSSAETVQTLRANKETPGQVQYRSRFVAFRLALVASSNRNNPDERCRTGYRMAN